jgi:hypothetical protein
MDERILEHLKLLNQYLLYLRELAQTDENKFVNDFKIRGSAERFLQLAIESCINVGNRILSITQFRKPVSTPETYFPFFKGMERSCPERAQETGSPSLKSSGARGEHLVAVALFGFLAGKEANPFFLD